jgi:heme exporter protein C
MPIVLKPSEPSLPPQMLTTFLLAFLVFAVLCLAFIGARYRVGVLRDLAAETIT